MGKITLLQDNKAALELKSGQHATFQAKAGKKYQLIQEALSKDGKNSNIIVVKKGAHLVLLMPDNTELLIENFYLDCAANQCAIQTNQVELNTKSGPAGPANGEYSLVYAEGDVEALKQISRGNAYLTDTLSHYGSVNGHLSVTPGEATPTVTSALHALGSASSVVGGPGAGILLAGAGAAGVGAAAGGGGGSGGAGKTPSNPIPSSKVHITSASKFSIKENTSSVTTLKADQKSVTWSLDNTGDAASHADNSLFSINSSTGALSFVAAPNFENAARSAVYAVKVKASYSFLSGFTLKTVTDTQALKVTVLDVVNEIKPEISLDSNVANGATSLEASTSLLTLNAINQNNGNSSLAIPNTHKAILTFSQGKNVVSKEVAGTGGALVINLSESEINQLGNGTVTISVISKDQQGNTSATTTGSFKLDTVAPRMTSSTTLSVAENMASIATLSANESVTWALDNSGTESAVYADNGKFSINSATGALSWSSNAGADFETPASAGNSNSYQLRVAAIDLAGNKSVHNLLVNVSNVVNENVPVIALNNYVSGNISAPEALDARGLISITNVLQGYRASVTFTDSNGNSVIKTSGASDGTNALTISLSNEDLSRLTDGNIKVQAISVDSQNNKSNNSTSLTLSLDKVAPAILGNGLITVAENQNAISTLSSSENANWALDSTGTDSSLYADNSLFAINPSTGALTWANGALGNYEWRGATPYKLRISATDSAGNSSVQNITLTLQDLPQIEATPQQALSSFVQGALSGDEATNEQGMIHISNIAKGHYAKVTLTNAAGNSITKTTAIFDGHRLGVALSASDLNSLGNGDIRVNSISFDAAGNSSAKSTTLVFTLDNSKPVISSNATLSNNENNNIVATLAATDNSSLTWSLDNSGSDSSVYADNSLFSINANTGVLTWASGNGRDYDSVKSAGNDHSYKLKVAAVDSAGNKTTQNLSVNLVNLNENPSVVYNPNSATVTSGVDSALPDIVLNDVDSEDMIHVKLVASSGTIKVPSGIVGLTNIGGANGSSTVTLSGTLDKINEGLKQATINTSSTSTITISYGDAASGNANFPQSTTLLVTPISASMVTDFNVSDTVGDTAVGLAAQALNFSVNFSQAITVTGTPTLTFQVGSNSSNTFTASYLAGSGSSTLSFKSTTGAPIASNGTLKLISINTDNTNSLKNNGVSVSTDQVGQTSSSFSVDTTAPSIGYLAKQYHALNLLFALNSSSEAEAIKVLDNYLAGAANNVYQLTPAQLSTFSALAGIYNPDSSRYTGGEYLGAGYWAPPSNYVAEYSRAMVNLQVGQMTSVPIKTQFGWHYIYLHSVNEVAGSDSGAAIDILFKENSSDKVMTFTSSETGATWSLDGVDASVFNINATSGVLTFKAAPNFESPTDVGADNVYNIAAVLTDKAGNISKRSITVNVSNDIAGETSASVAISGASNQQATIGAVLSASDSQTRTGGEAGTLSAAWRWQSQGLDGIWQDINGATNASYTLANTQNASAVRAIATYTSADGQVYRAYSSAINVAIAPTVAYALQDVLAQNGAAFNWSLPANTFADNDPLSYSVSGLPAGLSYNSNTRSISGSLNSASNLNVTITATDSTNLTASSSFTIKPVTGPFIKSFACTDNIDAYQVGKNGEALTIKLQFNEAVNIASGTSLTFQVGSNAAHTITASYSSGSGSTLVSFSANQGAPASSHGNLKLIGISNGSISAASGGAALASEFNQVDYSYRVDTSAPSASVALTGALGKVSNWLNVGDTVSATLSFDEDVLLYGTPQLGLLIGNSTVYASYVAADSSSQKLSFSYTIISGLSDTDGIAISGLNMNGGSIKNLAGIQFSGNSNVSDNAQFLVDTSNPTAATLTLDNSLTSNNVNRSEALTSGLIKISGVATGEIAEVTLSRTSINSSVVKYLNGNGNEQSLALNAQDLAILGNGTINVSVVKKDAAGNTSTSASNSFTLDTLAPSSPMLSLAAGIADGATNAEAKSATGVVNLLSEFGSNISVVLSKTGVTSINKSFSSTGSNIAVVLSDSELTSLGTGEVTLSAIATDSSGNTSLSSLINFNVI